MGHIGRVWAGYGAADWRFRGREQGMEVDDLGIDVAVGILLRLLVLLSAGDEQQQHSLPADSENQGLDEESEGEVRAGD